ncbi:MAG: aldolase/citrate lyase family protein [Pseudomonadota bacterium]
MAEVVANPVIERFAAGEVALGMLVRIVRTPDVARVAKATGHDFLFVDLQHSLFGLETLGAIAQTALGVGVAPIVRVRSVVDPDVSVLLDNGVSGVVFPDVETAEEAEQAVAVAKFAPLGRRSITGGLPAFDYRPVPQRESMALMNARTLCVCMIETVRGLENAEAIAAVEGVDVLHMGTSDLLADMGKPGEFDHPEIVMAQERVIEAAHLHGKVAGCGGNRSVERQAAIVDKGVRFLTTQADFAFLASAAGAWTRGIREHISRQ